MLQPDKLLQPTTILPVEVDEFDDTWVEPDISQIETEDDTPVDSLPTEKNQRILSEPLYSSWDGNGRQFVVCANVGVFYAPHEQPIVPDVFLSMDVQVAQEWYQKKHRSYFVWEFGKPPEITIEIVSNRKGGEAGEKMPIYSRIGVDHYVIFDPMQILGKEKLRVYERRFQRYVSTPEAWFEGIGLGLRLWEGEYEGINDSWLRWCYRDKTVVPTGFERAEQVQRQFEQAQHLAEQARQQAEQAQQVAAQEATLRQQAEAALAHLKAEMEQLRAGKPSRAKGVRK